MNQIKQLRTQAGLTQKQLGQALGVGQNAVSHWEKGLRQPDAATLMALAEYFGVTVDKVLGRAEEAPAPPEEGETYAILSRGARNLTEPQRRQLLDMARVLFKEAFADDPPQ